MPLKITHVDTKVLVLLVHAIATSPRAQRAQKQAQILYAFGGGSALIQPGGMISRITFRLCVSSTSYVTGSCSCSDRYGCLSRSSALFDSGFTARQHAHGLLDGVMSQGDTRTMLQRALLLTANEQ